MTTTPTGDMSKMTDAELREVGAPFFADPDELRKLGIDPEPFYVVRQMSNQTVSGHMLDRTRDREIIDRLHAMSIPPAVSDRAH